MFKRFFGIFKEKSSKKNGDRTIPGFISAVPDVRVFITQHKIIDCKAKTLSELIDWLETVPGQKWYVTKASKKKASLRNVGVYESFPDLETVSSWLEEYGGGKYYVKPLSLGKVKIGYYEFDGEDIEPEEEEICQAKRSNSILKKWKPKTVKEAILIQKAEEGDDKALNKLLGEDESGACVIQPEGVSLKEHFDKIEDLKDEIRKKDLQVLEERFKSGVKGSGWDGFLRLLETDSGNELGKETLATFKEIFKTSRSDGTDEEGDEKETGASFEEYKRKSLPEAGEQKQDRDDLAKDPTPLRLMYVSIQRNSDPSNYLETMRENYPEHSFCLLLIKYETVEQFLNKLKPLEKKLPLLFQDKGKAWLEELFAVIRESKKQAQDKAEPENKEATESKDETEGNKEEQKSKDEKETGGI